MIIDDDCWWLLMVYFEYGHITEEQMKEWTNGEMDNSKLLLLVRLKTI